jgi:uncharacterized membrane protein YqjE
MADRLNISGNVLASLYYLSMLTGLLILLLTLVPSMTNIIARWSLFSLFGLLIIALAVGLWRVKTGNHSSTQMGTAEDITYDPFADPGQAAKHRWRKAILSLKQQNDDEDE